MILKEVNQSQGFGNWKRNFSWFENWARSLF